MASNDAAGVRLRQPRHADERVDAAKACSTALKISMPLVVDEMDDRVGHAYSGMPDRLYLIDRAGRIAYKGGRGPFGFRPGELEQALVMCLLEAEPTPEKPAATPPKPAAPVAPAKSSSAAPTERLPLLTHEEAWKRLTGAPAMVQPLPTWARLLAGPLPLTTRRMLQLDALHRTGDRLEPRLRSLVRWAAADANGCDYARTVAIADLVRGGLGEAEARTLVADPTKQSPTERAVVAFARRMMREAHAVADAQVKDLLTQLGDERFVALVTLLAHASFQDRILLAVGARSEPNGPLPPLTAAFAEVKSPPATPKPAPNPGTESAGVAVPASKEWLALQAGLDRQRARAGRIRVPSPEDVQRRLGENHPALWQSGILWSRVCYGHQPELTDAWFACGAAFRQEAGLDRLFEQRLFWVVTRTLECFY